MVDSAKRQRCRSVVIDGEVVAFDQEGKPDFDALMPATRLRGRGLVYVAFDLTFIDGVDLGAAPTKQRRRSWSCLSHVRRSRASRGARRSRATARPCSPQPS